jgi:hypothetical protein
MKNETVDYGEWYKDIFLNDLDGYGKTAWGMTEDEVLRAETPRAERLERPGIFVGGRTATLPIKKLQTHAGKFNADFIFEDSNRRLVQVNLTSLDEKNPRAGSEAFSILKKLLTERYGMPKVENGLSEVASWKVGKTIIELVHLDIRQVSSFVVISYKSAMVGNVASGNP